MRIAKSKPIPSVVVKQEPVNQLSASSTTHKKRNSGWKSQATSTKACYRCNGTGHSANDCRFKEVTCNHCRKKGHIAKACRCRDRPLGAKPVRRVSEGDTEEDPIEPLMAVRSTGKYTPPLKVRVLIDNDSLPMELDREHPGLLFQRISFGSCGQIGNWNHPLLGYRHTHKSLSPLWVR